MQTQTAQMILLLYGADEITLDAQGDYQMSCLAKLLIGLHIRPMPIEAFDLLNTDVGRTIKAVHEEIRPKPTYCADLKAALRMH